MGFEAASNLFDLYVDWDRRLAREMPYLLARLKQTGTSRVADVACGSGYHACALAKAGFDVTAIDPDPALLEKTRLHAEASGVSLTRVQASFTSIPSEMAVRFDGAVCLGNSISLIAPGEDLVAALKGLARLLRPEGRLILHTINYPMLAKREQDPWGPVRVLDEDRLILKGFIPRESGTWDAQLIYLTKDEKKGWQRTAIRFALHPHTDSHLCSAAGQAGLDLILLHGGFQNEPHQDPASADLVYVFSRRKDH